MREVSTILACEELFLVKRLQLLRKTIRVVVAPACQRFGTVDPFKCFAGAIVGAFKGTASNRVAPVSIKWKVDCILQMIEKTCFKTRKDTLSIRTVVWSAPLFPPTQVRVNARDQVWTVDLSLEVDV